NRKILLIIILLLSSAIAVLYSCNGEKKEKQEKKVFTHNAFVGDQRCASCHQKQMQAWEGSHHDYAMKKATDKSVRGDFSDVVFSHQDESYRFYREDGKFMVKAPGPDGKPTDYQ